MSRVGVRVHAALADPATPDPPAGLFAAGAVTWHSYDEVEVSTLPDTFAALRAIRAVVPDFTLTNARFGPEDDETSTLRCLIAGALPDGSRLRAPAAIVIEIADGRATRLEEYADTAQLAPLFAALG